MQNKPLVSVLMTVYNREKYIAEAIESVLASTYTNWELIIVDDQSKDRSVEIAKIYADKDDRIKVYINEKNLGDYPNRNRAASYAKGIYIKYLDSDDLIYPYALGIMVYCMEKFPTAGYGLCAKPDQSGMYPILINAKETYVEHFLTKKGDHFNRAPGSSIIRRNVFEQVNGFSGKRMIGDYELWLNLSRNYDLVKIPRDIVWNRIHDGQESQSDYALKYDKLRKEVFLSAMNHPECPLNTVEKKRVLKLRAKNRIKSIILKPLKYLGRFYISIHTK
jgi:glycosyltransferase involved in cell wall biosynthesis